MRKAVNRLANWYTLTFGTVFLFFLWGILTFIAECVLYSCLLPLRSFYGWQRRWEELMGLILLGSLLAIPYFTLTYMDDGLLPSHVGDTYRYIAAIGSWMSVLSCMRKEWGSILLGGAAAASIPLWDTWAPVGWCIAVVLSGIRIYLLLPEAYRKSHEQITFNSIQEAVDTMNEGILLFEENGTPLLVNHFMMEVMQTIVGTIIRNGNVFWHLLQQGGGKDIHMERIGRKLLFRLPDGHVWMVSRDSITDYNEPLWQISAADVTALDKVNHQLAETIEILQGRNEKMKSLLAHLVEIESRDTLRDIRTKVHDLMGQRISILQQVLNNRDFHRYKELAPLIKNLLRDMEKDITVSPADRLAELIRTYQGLGIEVQIQGLLPPSQKISQNFVEIIREAMTNAICHGHANAVTIVLTEGKSYGLEIQDNGVGCEIPIHEGGGLSSIRRKVMGAKGQVRFKNKPHFVLTIDWPKEEKY